MTGPIKPSYEEKLLQIAISETPGLIGFTKKMRNESGKYSLKQDNLKNIFDTELWKEHKTKNGHRKLTNRVTKVVVEYGSHNKDIDPGAADTILDQVQKHINLLYNETLVFPQLYKHEGGYLKKRTPDIKASARKLIEKGEVMK